MMEPYERIQTHTNEFKKEKSREKKRSKRKESKESKEKDQEYIA